MVHEEKKFFHYLKPELVLFLESTHQKKVLLQLVQALDHVEKLKDGKAFYKALLDRENIVSTGIGMGVAIPHAQMKQFSNFYIVIGIQKGKGIDWKSLDKKPVRLIFVIGGPEGKRSDYLRLLSQLTSVLRNDLLRQKLFSLSTPEEVISIFRGK